MFLTKKDNKRSQNKNSLGNIKSLDTEQGPLDRYEEYLILDSKSNNYLNGSRNLFDDSAREDRNWFKLTKEFLER